MTLPANVRVNTLLPFPSQVTGSGPVAVSKVNGIWQILLSFTGLAQQSPTGTQLNTGLVLIYDTVARTFYTVPLSFFGIGGVSGAVNKQRSITSAANLPIVADDQQLNLNLSTPLTITLPPFGPRNGLALVFKDVGLQAGTNVITIAAASGETIDGFSSIVMDVNGETIALSPANDGLNAGWFVI